MFGAPGVGCGALGQSAELRVPEATEWECRMACSRIGGLALRNEEGLQSRQHI